MTSPDFRGSKEGLCRYIDEDIDARYWRDGENFSYEAARLTNVTDRNIELDGMFRIPFYGFRMALILAKASETGTILYHNTCIDDSYDFSDCMKYHAKKLFGHDSKKLPTLVTTKRIIKCLWDERITQRQFDLLKQKKGVERNEYEAIMRGTVSLYKEMLADLSVERAEVLIKEAKKFFVKKRNGQDMDPLALALTEAWRHHSNYGTPLMFFQELLLFAEDERKIKSRKSLVERLKK